MNKHHYQGEGGKCDTLDAAEKKNNKEEKEEEQVEVHYEAEEMKEDLEAKQQR